MKLQSLMGSYREEGVWRDSTGGVGDLAGRIRVILRDGCLGLAYGDGSTQLSEPIDGAGVYRLSGSLGNGRLFLGERSLVLEYEADVGGRLEHNTDSWLLIDGAIERVGLIRQAARTIWFEARLHRVEE